MQYYTMLYYGGKQKVKGRRIRVNPELDLFYCKTVLGHYFICELESGASLGFGNTLGLAKEQTILNIKSRGIKAIRAGIQNNIKQYGRANEVIKCK